MVESLSQVSADVPLPVLFRGKDLVLDTDLLNIKLVGEGDEDDTKVLSCAHFCLKNISAPAIFSAEVRNSLRYILWHDIWVILNTFFYFYFVFY